MNEAVIQNIFIFLYTGESSRARYGPVMGLCPNGPVFRSLNISTFQGLKTRNGPIILIIYTGPL